jgi:UDP-N-acetylmuramoylalanine--D-glutamate ligase
MTFSVRGQQIVVIGAGRSGLAAAALLQSRGARVTLADSAATRTETMDRLATSGVGIELGPHRSDLCTSADLVVVSPGVPPTATVELASRWLSGPVIAITGTKGKSTTTTLTARMLVEGGRPAVAGGNLGTALSSQVATSTADTLHVVEVSSFQLETTDTFHPWISVLVNLSPDHLDRHASFDEYAAAKARIFANQTATDWAVVNADDPEALALARGARARRFDFGFENVGDNGVTVEHGHVVERREGASRPLVPLAAVKLPGRHLLADVMAASAVSAIAGVSPAAMTRAVETFDGLEHALERVVTVDGVSFVNDSKATNVVSSRRAIESFERGVVPILGGRYKGGAFEDLREPLAARGRGVVVIGEAADRIAAVLSAVVPVRHAVSMDDAVRIGYELARPDGVVVLAPGCSSFDMFTDYAERGRAFKDAARALAMEVAGKV